MRTPDLEKSSLGSKRKLGESMERILNTRPRLCNTSVVNGQDTIGDDVIKAWYYKINQLVKGKNNLEKAVGSCVATDN